MSPRVLFVVDGGPQVGGGHVLRSLTLAQTLAEAGARPLFLAPPPVARILALFDPQMAMAPAASTAAADLIAAGYVIGFRYTRSIGTNGDCEGPDCRSVDDVRTIGADLGWEW
ncbi:MAG: UDP-2,4-diacetamido-2,4,6-trideoxy-beta-L-altropyranose hydrolase, partial [Phenylobacterium sp.]